MDVNGVPVEAPAATFDTILVLDFGFVTAKMPRLTGPDCPQVSILSPNHPTIA